MLAKDPAHPLAPTAPPLPAKARRVIYMHMAGSPSQLELFDYKPELEKLDGKDCPQALLEGKQFAFIQGIPKLLGPQFPFQRAGQSGQWISDRLPQLATVIDDLCFIKSMYTDQFNHGPAQLLMHTGTQNLGAASIGAWATYGLGSENQDLPGFIVLTSGGKNPDAGKSVWGAGYLPSVYQGVQCRSQGDPVLYLSDPPGVTRSLRRKTLDALAELNQQTANEIGDQETLTRIAQYELAFRMQTHAAEAFDIGQEPPEVHEAYGTQPGQESFANNCLLARRLAERGVRYIQLFDWGWDSHGAGKEEALNGGFQDKCRSVDRAAGRAADRSETDRSAAGHAGHLGRRVRSHLDARKPQRRRNGLHRPRPQSQRIHDLAGRRRRQSGLLARRNRRLRLSIRDRPRLDCRLPRHDAGAAGLRPPATDLSRARRQSATDQCHQTRQPGRQSDHGMKNVFVLVGWASL